MSPITAGVSALVGCLTDVREFCKQEKIVLKRPEEYATGVVAVPAAAFVPQPRRGEGTRSESQGTMPSAAANEYLYVVDGKSVEYKPRTPEEDAATNGTVSKDATRTNGVVQEKGLKTLSNVFPIPLFEANIDTDRIVPKQFLKTTHKRGLAAALFFQDRKQVRVAMGGTRTCDNSTIQEIGGNNPIERPTARHILESPWTHSYLFTAACMTRKILLLYNKTGEDKNHRARTGQ